VALIEGVGTFIFG